ncbi:type II toxin-antitoxin system RelE/ParE family toxin [Oceanispirochaeta crateris]|uniref:type II toxin-antitoxin system RelE/ParE family toxin n=1 Tax=Oceanispirochaeta crateris TaxID=2518645 RepID=UPI001AEF5D04|nr:type II toxin-antitoxin system RelE/ParE family toxin [Oceanispirochaeta crateris]
MLQEFGFSLAMPHSKKLTGYDLYELRVKFASDIVRMFYYVHNGKIFIISSGYIKKTNKTSKNEIEKAISLINRYLQEVEDESI